MRQLIGNRYAILREIGSGGMAWIYLAEDERTSQRVALKVLFPQFAQDVSYVQRFLREAKLAGALDSPHIVRVLDYGADRETHYLAMEYIEGQTVRERLDARGPYTPQEALNLVVQIADALEHAHHRGVVHRDIKPQNLMITHEGVLKVLDFGVARVRDLPSLTQSGFVGSPYYASPEQVMGERVGPASDIYSLGVALFEMVTGRLPFQGADPWAVISQHIATPPPPLPSRPEGWPPGLEAFIQRAMAKRPEDRFQSAAEMRQAAQALLAGKAVPLEPAAPQDQGQRLEQLYREATQARQEGAWHRAVQLLSQILSLDPDYRDAEEQLAEAGRQVRLAALYQAARQAVAAQRWQEARDELEEIVRMDPDYLDAAQLLPRTRERAQAEASDVEAPAPPEPPVAAPQAPPEEKPEPPPALTPEAPRPQRRTWLWGLGLLAAVILVVAGLWVLPRSEAWLLARQYNRGVAALRQEQWDQAIAALDRVLARDPGYREAQRLRDQAQRMADAAGLEAEAQAAAAEGQWEEALGAWEALREQAPGYHPQAVKEGLCAASAGRGQEATGAFQEGGDPVLLREALMAFRQAEQTCPPEAAGAWQETYLAVRAYVQGEQAAEAGDWDRAVTAWRALYQEKPQFGDVAERLYEALLARGREHQAAGRQAAAREDYEAALQLPVDDASQAQEALEGLGEEDYRYPPPRLLSPPDGATFTSGRFTEIYLEWEPVGPLADDEFYNVTVMRRVGGEPRYWGAGLRETRWRVPPLAGYREADDDLFYWWVVVRQATTTTPDGKPDGPPISPQSEPHTFIWR